ncbi:FecR family protein [Sphingobacterium sp. BIGb0165]|uniref:FecR family protein n=1 Tax=Sphingobacterium sp. BIGb0165 TaxID=2940615 RepID=UPI0021675108|nr:FecR family protein [Sphingobacterium sp. BIGb0165]MCS4224064.1 hypothetical protein [Sphingobacterium sp. BIGb0165]
MKKPEIIDLIKKILRKQSSEDELCEVDDRLLDAYHDATWDEDKFGPAENIETQIKRNVEQLIQTEAGNTKKISIFRRYLPYAASLLLAVSSIAGYYFFKGRNADLQVINQRAYLNPGAEKASLKNSDGSSLDLQQQQVGDTVPFGKLLFKIDQEGIISYQAKTENKNMESQLVTLATPKGGKYQINLEDGTKVWLNAESSLIFPEHFAADRRLVQVKGEAYFEVAESKYKPFIVEGNGFGVRVLGTKFNVSDRDNLHVAKVALLQGSVSLTSKAGQTMLKPGERAKISASGVQIDQFDAESEIAWKNNYFIYKDENIKTIMADVAQWYDAEVIFEGKDWDDVNLKMKVSRRENIEEILSLLELTKSIKFKIVERRIYVTKR